MFEICDTMARRGEFWTLRLYSHEGPLRILGKGRQVLPWRLVQVEGQFRFRVDISRNSGVVYDIF